MSGEVTAYDPASSGVVSPVQRLAGPFTGLKDSWAVVFDTAGDLFVQNFLGDSTTGVFGPDVNGDTAPLWMFKNQAVTRYNGGFLVVNYSPFTNLIYAAVSGDFNPGVSVHISVFPVHGNGGIKPVRTIRQQTSPGFQSASSIAAGKPC